MKIEGKNAVTEAIKSGTNIDCLYVEKGSNHPIIALARERGIKSNLQINSFWIRNQ
jgi:RNA 2''-O ribose methyltransferase substrate binding.